MSVSGRLANIALFFAISLCSIGLGAQTASFIDLAPTPLVPYTVGVTQSSCTASDSSESCAYERYERQMKEGYFLLRQHQFEQALKRFSAALDTSKALFSFLQSEANAGTGLALLGMGNYAQAISVFSNDKYRNELALGIVFFLTGDLDKAKTVLTYVQVDPLHYRMLEAVLRDNSQGNQARDLFISAYREDSSKKWALERWFELDTEFSNWQDILWNYSILPTEAQANARIKLCVALASLKLGLVSKAIPLLLDVIRENKNFLAALELLADSYQVIGDRTTANKYRSEYERRAQALGIQEGTKVPLFLERVLHWCESSATVFLTAEDVVDRSCVRAANATIKEQIEQFLPTVARGFEQRYREITARLQKASVDSRQSEAKFGKAIERIATTFKGRGSRLNEPRERLRDEAIMMLSKQPEFDQATANVIEMQIYGMNATERLEIGLMTTIPPINSEYDWRVQNLVADFTHYFSAAERSQLTSSSALSQLAVLMEAGRQVALRKPIEDWMLAIPLENAPMPMENQQAESSANFETAEMLKAVNEMRQAIITLRSRQDTVVLDLLHLLRLMPPQIVRRTWVRKSTALMPETRKQASAVATRILCDMALADAWERLFRNAPPPTVVDTTLRDWVSAAKNYVQNGTKVLNEIIVDLQD